MSALIKSELGVRGIARVLVYLKDGAGKDTRSAAMGSFVRSEFSTESALSLSMHKKGAVRKGRYFKNLGIMIGTVDSESLKDLRSMNEVRRVSAVPQISLIQPVGAAKLTKLRGSSTWGIRELKADRLWKKGLTGAGVRVGHLDTGVDGKHSALKGAVEGFASFDGFGTREARAAGEPAFDTGTHGTHTAGTIAGRPVQGHAIGVAPGSELHSAVVIEGGDVPARVLAGLDWLVGQRVRVINASLGFPGWRDEFLPLIRLVRSRGILPVFAVGNEGAATSRSPGNYGEVLSIGASDRGRQVAEFSSSDHFDRENDPYVPDFVAPGVAVQSATPGGGYVAMNGTSMAAPHVTGLAALLWEAHPEATLGQVEAAILGSCAPLAHEPVARQGRGLPNAVRAEKILAEE